MLEHVHILILLVVYEVVDVVKGTLQDGASGASLSSRSSTVLLFALAEKQGDCFHPFEERTDSQGTRGGRHEIARAE